MGVFLYDIEKKQHLHTLALVYYLLIFMDNLSNANALNKSDIAKWVGNSFGMIGTMATYLAMNWTGSKSDYIYAAFIALAIGQDLVRRYTRGDIEKTIVGIEKDITAQTTNTEQQ